MRNIEDLDVLILPGWRGSGPEHWQTHWEAAFPAMRRVEQADWERPVCADWARNLGAAVAGCDKPVAPVAHNLANAFVACWSQEADTIALRGDAEQEN